MCNSSSFFLQISFCIWLLKANYIKVGIFSITVLFVSEFIPKFIISTGLAFSLFLHDEKTQPKFNSHLYNSNTVRILFSRFSKSAPRKCLIQTHPASLSLCVFHIFSKTREFGERISLRFNSLFGRANCLIISDANEQRQPISRRADSFALDPSSPPQVSRMEWVYNCINTRVCL